MKTAAFDVFRPSKFFNLQPTWIDRVFYDEDMSAEEVRRSLVNHDGYSPDITVRKEVR